jgi:Aldo/keto reductase family
LPRFNERVHCRCRTDRRPDDVVGRSYAFPVKPSEVFGIENPQAVDNARIGMGCMRLSTEPDRDEARAIEVLHAALDLGVTFLDTADAYCLNDSETGHNERLIARALNNGAATAPASSSPRKVD